MHIHAEQLYPKYGSCRKKTDGLYCAEVIIPKRLTFCHGDSNQFTISRTVWLFTSLSYNSFLSLSTTIPTIIEKLSRDARSILVVVFLTASANFTQRFSNNNVHVA